MQQSQHFLWLTDHALSTLLTLWPITVGFLVAIFAVGWRRKFAHGSGGGKFDLVPFLLLFSAIFILVVGSLFSRPSGADSEGSLAGKLLIIAIVSAQALASILIVRARPRARLMASLVVGFAAWVSLVCLWISLMSITGNWI